MPDEHANEGADGARLPTMSEATVPVDHPRFRRAWTAIFTRRMAADCMTHSCAVVEPRREKLDVCCQYGCDVDLAERDAILARAADVRAVLRPDVRDRPWFEDEETVEPEYPSGRIVRTESVDGACIFLAHDRRGCALHRVALERGFDLLGFKPAVCRLYPLYFEGDTLVISEEYPEYSCAHVTGPTLYRLVRDVLADLWGAELVRALDDAERRVASTHANARVLESGTR